LTEEVIHKEDDFAKSLITYSALLDMNSENLTSETTDTHNFHEIIFKLAVSCPFYLIDYMFLSA
jgi:hypothetical protein